MRTAMLVVAVVLCLPLWAQETVYPLTDLLPLTLDAKEETDPFADLPVSFSAEYGNRTSYFRIDEQIFHLRMTHNGEYFSQVDMDFAVFSPGEECLNDNWSLGPTAWYPRAPGENSNLIGRRPVPARMYLQFHHMTRRLEARIYIPLMYKVENQRVMPRFELERLTLLELDRKKTTLYLRGWYEPGKTPDLDLGVSRLFGSVEFKACTDLLKPGTDFGFSVGLKVTANH